MAPKAKAAAKKAKAAPAKKTALAKKKAAPAKKAPAKKAAPKKAKAGLTLKYWNGRGLMEVPRMMLAISGKFPGSGYEDWRPTDGYAEVQKMGDALNANLGRMPVIETSEGDIGQALAINYFVASQCGLMGGSTFEAATILAFAEHVRECGDAYRKLVPYGSAPEKKDLDTWFGTKGASDHSGVAVMVS